MFIIRGKRRDLNDSHTLGCSGRNNSKPRIGSSGHTRGMRPGQTRKKPKDLCTREREESDYTSQHLTRGGHPQSFSTMHYGQVQKKQWTQLSDVREDVEWSVTPPRD